MPWLSDPLDSGPRLSPELWHEYLDPERWRIPPELGQGKREDPIAATASLRSLQKFPRKAVATATSAAVAARQLYENWQHVSSVPWTKLEAAERFHVDALCILLVRRPFSRPHFRVLPIARLVFNHCA